MGETIFNALELATPCFRPSWPRLQGRGPYGPRAGSGSSIVRSMQHGQRESGGMCLVSAQSLATCAKRLPVRASATAEHADVEARRDAVRPHSAPLRRTR